jgi:hypothetical protein
MKTAIKTERDYKQALKEIEGLMSANKNTCEGDRLNVLVTLVEAWEAKHYPLDLPDTGERTCTESWRTAKPVLQRNEAAALFATEVICLVPTKHL